MMLPRKEGAMIKVPHKPRKHLSFKKKDNELMEDYIDDGIGNYVILDMEHNEILEKVQDMENQECMFEGYWRMSFDGACSNSGSGVGIVLMSPSKIVHPHAIRLEFSCTNNEAKYEALIRGMILEQEMKIEHLIVTGDSELVINQVTQKYKIKKERLKLYFKRVNELMEYFSSFNISFIPRDKNHKADSLALAASLSNPDNIQRKMYFQVERAFRPSVPHNMEYLQVFENDEGLEFFLLKMMMIKTITCLLSLKIVYNISLFLQKMIMLRISGKKFQFEKCKKQERSILELIVPRNMSTWESIVPMKKLTNMLHCLKSTLMCSHGPMMI
jgi:ribonuclease HI